MFQIVIPIHNQHKQAYLYLDSWFCLSKGPLDVLFIDNGSDDLWKEHKGIKIWRDEGHKITVIRNDENTGVYPTFQQGLDATTSQWVFYSHSDVEMVVPGWDLKLLDLLSVSNEMQVGVAGMFGAKGIGTPEIYKAPYDFRQLMRWDCYTVEHMSSAGGDAIKGNFKRVMVLDGFSLIVNRDMIDKIGGFKHDEYPVHHCYDNDICLESHFAGFKNYVFDIDCIHHGGMTSTHEKWADGFDSTDLKIHRLAHIVMYDKWRGKLPVSVE